MLILFALLGSALSESIISFNAKYGYIGPACAVEDGQLFLHGVLARNLSQEEADDFRLYQKQLQTFHRLSSQKQVADAPLIPQFCGELDDSLEVVLKKCLVRNHHVYVGETLLRPLTNLEKQKIITAINRRSSRIFFARNFYQQKRTRREALPGENISDLLHRVLKVNSSITARFLPMMSQSAFFNQNLPAIPEPKPISASSARPAASPKAPKEKKARKQSSPARVKATTTATTPSSTVILDEHNLNKWKPIIPDSTVQDPTILSIIARALAHNDPSVLGEIEKYGRSASYQSITNNGENEVTENTLPLQPGTRTMINGKSYVAVPLEKFSPESSYIGSNIDTEPTEDPVDWDAVTTTPASTTTSSTTLRSITKLRLSKKKSSSTIIFDLPDEICIEHLRIPQRRD